jgi:hypothetical protein
MGHQKAVNGAIKQMTDRFDCNVLGNMDEYVGSVASSETSKSAGLNLHSRYSYRVSWTNSTYLKRGTSHSFQPKQDRY